MSKSQVLSLTNWYIVQLILYLCEFSLHYWHWQLPLKTAIYVSSICFSLSAPDTSSFLCAFLRCTENIYTFNWVQTSKCNMGWGKKEREYQQRKTTRCWGTAHGTTALCHRILNTTTLDQFCYTVVIIAHQLLKWFEKFVYELCTQ